MLPFSSDCNKLHVIARISGHYTVARLCARKDRKKQRIQVNAIKHNVQLATPPAIVQYMYPITHPIAPLSHLDYFLISVVSIGLIVFSIVLDVMRKSRDS
jgi:hypothetical protein